MGVGLKLTLGLETNWERIASYEVLSIGRVPLQRGKWTTLAVLAS